MAPVVCDVSSAPAASIAHTVDIIGPTTVEVVGFPASHDGSTHFAFELSFSKAPVDATPARIEALVSVTNATVEDARRVEDGNDLRWTVEIAPTAVDIARVDCDPR